MGFGDSQLIPSLGMSHLTSLPIPYFHGMLKSSDPKRAVGFQPLQGDLKIHIGSMCAPVG